MLIRFIEGITKLVSRQIPPQTLGWVPVVSLAGLQVATPNGLASIFDGILLATPKRRTPKRKIMTTRYGDDNWKDGTKMYKAKRNLTTCSECGHFHEFHTICKNCFKKVQEESEKIIKSIRDSWGGAAIDKEVQVLYAGDSVTPSEKKRIVEVERPRPFWFVQNLSQKAANPKDQSSGSFAKEALDLTIKVKGDS